MFPFYIPENIRNPLISLPPENVRKPLVCSGYRYEKFSDVFWYIKRTHWSEMG